MHSVKSAAWVSLALVNVAFAHASLYHKAMYCFNGTDPNGNPNNNNAPSQPLWDLPYSQYWMHHSNGCDDLPPDPDTFMELPAGSKFEAELAVNRAFTSWNTDPNAVIGAGLDGSNYTIDYGFNNGSCIGQPNIHTHNYSTAAGTAIAIAYKSDITQVGIEDLVVISTVPNSPFFRRVDYDIPSGLKECPDGGCICVIPGICGEPNIYIFPYRCKVIPDSTPPKTLGTPKPPVWCGDDPSQCVTGPKQIMIWNQADRNNIEVEGFYQGENKHPAYNPTCGYKAGAQDDIFVESTNQVELAQSPSPIPSSTPIPSSSPSPVPTSLPADLNSSPDPSSVPPPNWSSIPSGSGWPGPSGDPTPCGQGPQPSNSGNPDPVQRSKRMHHRRETRNIF